MMSARMLAIAVALLLGGCVDRQADFDDELPDEFAGCMVVPAWGYYADGSQMYMYNEWGRTGTVCMCMDLQELMDQSPEDELNDLAYEECVRIGGLYEFESTDCEAFYEEGKWVGIVPAVDGDAWMNQTGLSCGEDDGSELGCVAAGEQPRAPWALLVLAWAFVRRRNH